MVPNGWEIKQLADLTTKISDGIHSTPKYTEKSDIHFINGNNLKNGSITISSTTKKVCPEDAENHRRDLSDRTILMSINGTIGNLAFYNNENVVLGKSACYINVNHDVDIKYIYYTLDSSKTQAFYTTELTGSTIKNLSLKTIKSTKILTPPLQEQQKIAKILTTWDKAINTTERLIDNSKQQKKALMQQLLTGKKRLLDDNGKRFEGEWEEVQLSEIGKCIAGLTYSPSDVVEDSGLLVLRSSNIQNGILSFEDNVYVRPDVKLKSKTKENDILICVRNGSKNLIGKSALIKGRAINQAHGAFMTIYRSKYPHYVFHLFQSDLYYRQVKRNLGATINSINTGDLNKFKFYMPSDSKEIKKIAAVLTNADKEIELLEQQLADLQQEKKALMQQLLTGKKRVLV